MSDMLGVSFAGQGRIGQHLAQPHALDQVALDARQDRRQLLVAGTRAKPSGLAAHGALEPSGVLLPARQLARGDVARAPREHVEQKLGDQGGPPHLAAARVLPLDQQVLQLGAELGEALDQIVDRDAGIEQGGRQPEVFDDGHAGRLERGLLVGAEQPRQQAPVKHLTPGLVGTGRRGGAGRGRRTARGFGAHRRVGAGRGVVHRLSSRPARSRSTATTSPALASALTTLGSVGPNAQSPLCAATCLRLTVASTASGRSVQPAAVPAHQAETRRWTRPPARV